MTKCAACGREMDELEQIYYREDDVNEEKPYCESCATKSVTDIQPQLKRFRTNRRIGDLESKSELERLQTKMAVIGFLNILSGVGQLLLMAVSPFLAISGLIQIGIGVFLIFY